MNINITPYKKGDRGTICLMLKRNIPIPKEGYEEGNCPICNSEVWITPQAKSLINTSPELKFACTECALREGIFQ